MKDAAESDGHHLVLSCLTDFKETNIQDQYQPEHILISLRPSGRRYKGLKTVTSRFKNSFQHQSITEFLNHSA